MKTTWVLEGTLPKRYPGVHLDPDWALWTYTGRELPEVLHEYAAKRHSWEAYVQRVIRGEPYLPTSTGPRLPLRDYQAEQAKRIGEAFANGAPGYLLNYPIGSGKTPITIASADEVDRSGGRILVVTTLAMVPAWRASIDQFSEGAHQWVVINPAKLWKIFSHPTKRIQQIPGSFRMQAIADAGLSRVNWDLIAVDEAQMLAQADSFRARMVRRLEARFTVFATATPFTRPEETAYVAPLIAWAAKVDPPVDVEDGYVDWLKSAVGLQLRTDEDRRWTYAGNSHDVSRLTGLLYRRGVGAAAGVAELGLPEQARTLVEIELTPDQRRLYDKAWLDFLDERGRRFTDLVEPSTAMSMVLRNLQKASLLKVPHLADIVVDQVEKGFQVSVPMFFLESVDALAEAVAEELKRRGLDAKVVKMTGRDTLGRSRHGEDVRERKRQAFQTGAAKVAVFNAYEGINLQAGERNIDGRGTNASDTPRVTVLADVLTGGKRALQAEGRSHRNGQVSQALYPYAVDTAEQESLAKVFASMASTRALSGATRDAEALTELAGRLRRGTLPMPEHGTSSLR